MSQGDGREARNAEATNAEAMNASWERAFSLLAVRQPDREAVVAGDAQLRYGDLERDANRLARRLVRLGVGAGVPVGVCLPRTPEAVTSFLAVLKAGGAYLPLDPELPAERLAAMLARRPAALVTRTALQQKLPAPALGAVALDAERTELASESGEALDVDVSADAWAYVLYTSGSTTAPRGVAVSRRALARYAASLAEALPLSEEDAYLHTASFSFSASIRGLVAPLSVGAPLVLADEGERRDPIALLRRMRSANVRVWDTVPSVWRRAEQVLSRLWPGDPELRLPESLRRILLTGEPLRWDLVRAWRAHLDPRVEIVNLYSQTETTGSVAFRPVRPGDEQRAEGETVPLGQALPGVELRLQGEAGAPVPQGEPGEIWIASDRLADGYVDDPERTTARFVSLPEPSGPPLRLYRSGDRARRSAEGELVWVGRSDRRVKVRGASVDLEEVESALRADPAVREAAVLARDIRPDERSLSAYLVPVDPAQLSETGLRRRLRERLPEPAVPARIAPLEALPTTASGKIDYAALASREDAAEGSAVEAASPADPTEAALLEIWERVLAYRPASVLDDFFDRGGDSLRAVDLFIGIEERLGVRLPPAALFEAPSVRLLAEQVRAGAMRSPEVSALTIREVGSRPPLFFVHSIWDFMPHYRTLARGFREDQPVHVLEPLGDDARRGRTLDLEALAARYARQVRSVCPEGPVLLAGISIGGLMAFEVAQHLAGQGDPPAGLFLLDTAAPELRSQRRRYRAGAWLERRERWIRALSRQWRSFRLPPREQGRRLVAKIHRVALRSWDRIGAARSRARRERFKEDYRRVADRYVPSPYDGPVILFRSEAPAGNPALEKDLGWGAFARHLEVVNVPGDHCSMIFPPLVDAFAETMQRYMDRAAQDAAARDDRVGAASLATSPVAEEREIAEFAERSRALSGQIVTEREPWNGVATRDAIRHFAYGTADDNPLWLDPDHARAGGHDGVLAPPAFLISVLYPVLHGSTEGAPLSSLLRDIEFQWQRPIREGERLLGTTRQGGVEVVRPRGGLPRVYVETLATYQDESGREVGRARSTVVRLRHRDGDRVVDRGVHRYRPEELARIVSQIDGEVRTGRRVLTGRDVDVGQTLPPIVRGPLTIGDLICWHAAVGPAYRPGPLGLKDTRAAPGFTVVNPLTGWPVKFTHQHEDPNLSGQRGMPGPFDNGVMRFAWAAPLLTNWLGDAGFLERLRLTIHAPVLYGDTSWYTGTVVSKHEAADRTRVRVRVTGTNQLGAVTTAGDADVLLP